MRGDEETGLFRYVDNVTVLLRTGDNRLVEIPVYSDAALATLEVGEAIDVEVLEDKVTRWLGAQNALYTFEVRRAHHEVGASALTASVVVTVVASGVTQIVLEELWAKIRTLLPQRAKAWNPIGYLLQLDDSDLAQELQRQVAGAVDRRRSELSLVHLHRKKDAVRAVFETPDDVRYEVRATDTLYLIRKVS